VRCRCRYSSSLTNPLRLQSSPLAILTVSLLTPSKLTVSTEVVGMVHFTKKWMSEWLPSTKHIRAKDRVSLLFKWVVYPSDNMCIQSTYDVLIAYGMLLNVVRT
jgi:hypothetical protein